MVLAPIFQHSPSILLARRDAGISHIQDLVGKRVMLLPEMNGRDLAGQISELYPGIRLLFMSGYTADVIAHQGVLDD
ncbi:MAG: ABC transporter substrate-binding protein, partial [Desulfobacteraceae bacterium]|nr:ABC transporter substrate-binding protein [Desulfobacteraceae bacterium]